MIFAFFKTMPASYPISYSAKKKEQAERGLFHKVYAICIYVFAANLTYIFLFHERKKFNDIFPELINRLICNFLAHDMPHYPIKSRTTIVRRSLRNRK